MHQVFLPIIQWKEEWLPVETPLWCVFPVGTFGTHLNSAGKTTDIALEKRNFKAAADIVRYMVGNGIHRWTPCFAEYIDAETLTLPQLPDEDWLKIHVRQSRYTLQIRKCEVKICCNAFDVFLTLMDRECKEEDEKFEFGELSDRLALTNCLPKPVCFDEHCPSMKTKWVKMMCSNCGLYMSSIKRRNTHQKGCKLQFEELMELEDLEGTDKDDEYDLVEEYQAVQGLKDGYNELYLENLKYDP
uniref:Uncharacterized protein n=1 Tax=Ditylenchus dipsaci TaxID=166011 RepID=A0A915CWF7_9BILA